MKRSKQKLSAPDRNRVKKYVRELSRLEKKCFLTRKKTWAVLYLVRVYELYTNWQRRNVSTQRKADLASYKYQGATVRKDKTLLHLIFDCTSSAATTAKTKSRWASALLAAEAKNINPKKIERFLLKEGKGVAGRAAEHAKIKRKKAAKKAGKKNKSSKWSVPINSTKAKSPAPQNNDNDNDNDKW